MVLASSMQRSFYISYSRHKYSVARNLFCECETNNIDYVKKTVSQVCRKEQNRSINTSIFVVFTIYSIEVSIRSGRWI